MYGGPKPSLSDATQLEPPNMGEGFKLVRANVSQVQVTEMLAGIFEGATQNGVMVND